MIDIGKHLQRAYDDGYRRGVKDTLDDIHKTLERSLREKVSHLTEPNNCKDEPQTKPKCEINEGQCDECGFCEYEPKDEPQTEAKRGCTHCKDKADCPDAFTEVSQYCGAYEQTDCPWK